MRLLTYWTAAMISGLLFVPPTIARAETRYEVVPYEDIDWGALNPARGDESPRAGDLWGDRTGESATGFLVRFDQGFSSPPHIHNVTYRGVVIRGEVHNDDPDAAPLWLPAESYWVQPAGEVHITAARASFNLAYIEIDSGPYLVEPGSEAFDNGERPINVAPSNFVWLDGDDVEFLPAGNGTGAEMAFLWQDAENGERGMLLRLAAGYRGEIATAPGHLRAVVASGSIDYTSGDAGIAQPLGAGSYFGSAGKAVHKIGCDTKSECTVYLRSDAPFTLSN